MSEPRTLLVIAGEFPPLKTIGRIRTVKFVDQLRQHGWRSIVITLKPSGTEPNYDPSLMAEIVDGVEVVRVPIRNREDEIANAVKRLLGRKPAAPSSALPPRPALRWRWRLRWPRRPPAG
jgi:hypothetical protein